MVGGGLVGSAAPAGAREAHSTLSGSQTSGRTLRRADNRPPLSVIDRQAEKLAGSAQRGEPARPPTDPDVRISRIRFVKQRVRYATYTEWTTRARGSGKTSSSWRIRVQFQRDFHERRFNHLYQIFGTRCRSATSARPLPVIPK